MAFGRFDSDNTQAMAEINTTPLVDVMLVLLIIFMVTAPLMTQSFDVTLPSASGSHEPLDAEVVQLEISAKGLISWNSQNINEAELSQHFQTVSDQSPDTQIHILADKAVAYEHIARVMEQAKQHKIRNLGFRMLVK